MGILAGCTLCTPCDADGNPLALEPNGVAVVLSITHEAWEALEPKERATARSFALFMAGHLGAPVELYSADGFLLDELRPGPVN